MTNDANFRLPVDLKSGSSSASRSPFEDALAKVTSIIYGMWRFRWPAILLAWVVAIGGATYVFALPNVYRATARVYIDTESMIQRVVGDLAIRQEMASEIQMLTRIMLSQPQLQKTASLANLDLGVSTPREQERLIELLRARIYIANEGGDGIFRIGYQDSDRATAELVVKTILDTFVEEALGERRTDSGAAVKFLDDQISDYERRLAEAEKRLADFKRDNIGLMPGEAGDYYTRLQGEMQKLGDLKAQLRLASERRAAYNRQLEGEEPVFGIVSPSSAAGGSSANDALIAQYEADVNSLLLRFTENHPDVIALRETIARLKKQKEEEVIQSPVLTAPTSGADELDLNPVYQRMKIGRGETDVEIASLTSQVQAQESLVNDLKKLTDTIPDIERQLTALNRDYSVTKENYETLLKRRESLRITGDVQQSGDQLQFRIIDPPRAQLDPVGPDRPMLLAAVGVAALGIGLGLAFLVQQLTPVFTTRRELRDIVGLPVLGVISLARSGREKAIARQRMVVYAVVVMALPAFLLLSVVGQNPLHNLVSKLIEALPI